ncbi:MAG: DUF2304 domain-containing protein [Roseburia sp.]|nr:DUF2304 domain-containing protein [Ruminococcus sp.]MCM1153928.1 DUF2304 domain-containing protein [Roseburia sp.]MCM1242589.1 DUF2304 domain-containing protein [Roseburia sp.]
MIPSSLRVTLIVAVICYFIIILYFLKQRALNLKYTLLWLLSGAVLGILVIYPELLSYIIHILGIEDNMNGLFIICIAFMLMIMMALTSIASRQNMKIRQLVQELGILDKRIRELEQDKETTREDS